MKSKKTLNYKNLAPVFFLFFGFYQLIEAQPKYETGLDYRYRPGPKWDGLRSGPGRPGP